MTVFSTNLGEGMAPLALPWLRLCFGPPLGNFLRTPLTVSDVLLHKPKLSIAVLFAAVVFMCVVHI